MTENPFFKSSAVSNVGHSSADLVHPPTPDPKASQETLQGIGRQLQGVEQQVLNSVLHELTNRNPGRDRTNCDRIFGVFTHGYLLPCLAEGLGSRPAWFSRLHLVPAVLQLEQHLHVEFHKGALFYDTALAHLLAGNEDGYEYFLAMTDEEEVRTAGGTHQRGTANLRSGGISNQTLTERLEFACRLLNGAVAGIPININFMTAVAPINAGRLDIWRQTLDAMHQFEFLRIIHDVEVFTGTGFPNVSASRDNPFVLLRLAKALSHLSQWVESCLTLWQGAAAGTLSPKLTDDPDFGVTLSAAAGSKANFARNPPHGGAVDMELRQLLTDLANATAGPQRSWRILRILYIVRNATAHTIEAGLAIYQDRQLLLSLIQLTFVSVFVISQLKTKPMP